MDIFNKIKSNKLLLKSKANYQIEVDSDIKLKDIIRYNPLYKMIVKELKIYRFYI